MTTGSRTTFRIGTLRSPISLDPIHAHGIGSKQVIGRLFDALYEYGEGTDTVPKSRPASPSSGMTAGRQSSNSTTAFFITLSWYLYSSLLEVFRLVVVIAAAVFAVEATYFISEGLRTAEKRI